MTNDRQIRRYLIVIFIAMSAGCAVNLPQSKTSVTFAQLRATADSILKAAIFARYANHKFNDKGCKLWLEKNKEYIHSADLLIFRTTNRKTTSWQGQEYTAAALAYRRAAESEAIKHIKAAPLERKATSYCDSLHFDHQLAEQLTLNQSNDMVVTSVERSIPLYSGTGNLPQEHQGRSFFVAEQLVKRHGCNAWSLVGLTFSWPEEIYLVSCANGDKVVQCQWNQCRILQ